MVHFTKVIGIGQTLKQREKALEEGFFKGLEDMVRRDQVKQKMKIQTKLASGKKLSDFEKWFVTTPEYHNIGGKMVN